ncbi:MAG: hypothetical protein HYY44_09620 [Deltaproteobacteria bacterium]|nr:hypothetical protein [Deltaproteobacteria bacterium]MBI4373809.1 hypothetical protein [Deltaproteobacteria bacterium]
MAESNKVSVSVGATCVETAVTPEQACWDELAEWQIEKAPKMVRNPKCRTESIPLVAKYKWLDSYQDGISIVHVATCTGIPTADYLKKLGIKK